MKKQYFNNITTLEELKKAYKELAFKLHPDRNKDKDTTTEFQNMSNQYQELFKKIQSNSYDPKINADNFKTYQDIIEELIKLNNEYINIEIIGSWIWITGKGTYQIKEDLLKLNFWWSTKHKTWIYNGGKKCRYARTNMDKENIENSYGKKVIQTEKDFSPITDK